MSVLLKSIVSVFFSLRAAALYCCPKSIKNTSVSHRLSLGDMFLHNQHTHAADYLAHTSFWCLKFSQKLQMCVHPPQENSPLKMYHWPAFELQLFKNGGVNVWGNYWSFLEKRKCNLLTYFWLSWELFTLSAKPQRKTQRQEEGYKIQEWKKSKKQTINDAKNQNQKLEKHRGKMWPGNAKTDKVTK